jgi:SOS-response transcriptional repressor LexA
MAGDHSTICDDLMRLKPDGMSPNGWAMKAGVSRTVWSDMRRHGNPSRRTLEKLLTAVGSSLAEFEALRIGGNSAIGSATRAALSERSGTWGSAHLPPLPLIMTAIGGEWADAANKVELVELRPSEIVDRVPRPVSLASDASAYAITIVGDSMWPRFRPGRRVAVSVKLPVAIGDDVLVKLASPSGNTVHVLIKELVRRTERGVDLRQFNPDMTFHVPAAEITGIEKVVGELV